MVGTAMLYRECELRCSGSCWGAKIKDSLRKQGRLHPARQLLFLWSTWVCICVCRFGGLQEHVCTRQFRGAGECVCVRGASPPGLCLADSDCGEGTDQVWLSQKTKDIFEERSLHAVLPRLVLLFFLRNGTLPFSSSVVMTCPSHVYNLF